MWYVVQVTSGKEQYTKLLIEKLVDKSLYDEVFIPRFESMKRYRGQWQLRTSNLLPGYLFVVTNKQDALAAELRGVPAFTRLLGNNDIFTPLDTQEISFLSAFFEEGARVVRMSQGVIEGDTIVILKGPLMHQRGLITKVDRHRRLCWLEISILGRTKTMKVGLEIVKKVPQ